MNSVYPSYPACFGAICEITCCCLACDVMMCKPTEGHPDHYCTALRAQIDFTKVTVCMKSRTQICCLDSRAAIPPDEREVPCMVSMLGLTCLYANHQTCRCCATLSSLEAGRPE